MPQTTRTHLEALVEGGLGSTHAWVREGGMSQFRWGVFILVDENSLFALHRENNAHLLQKRQLEMLV